MGDHINICTEVPSDEEFPLPAISDSDDQSESDSGSEYDSSDDESEAADSSSESGSSDDEDDEDAEDEEDEEDAEEEVSVQPVYQHNVMAPISKLWPNGKTLRVRFLQRGPSSDIRSKIKRYAKEWEKYANIKFHFATEKPSDIRISFRRAGGWNSKVGTDALRVPEGKHTMNLAVRSSTNVELLRRHVLHEFGHALGCKHEHSSPSNHIPWNKKAVYAYYRKQGWDRHMVDSNVLKKYDKGSVSQFSKFDTKSIMLYPIPSALTTNGFHTAWNLGLSRTDKIYIAKAYPKTEEQKAREKKERETKAREKRRERQRHHGRH